MKSPTTNGHTGYSARGPIPVGMPAELATSFIDALATKKISVMGLPPVKVVRSRGNCSRGGDPTSWAREQLRCELLERLGGKRPTRVIVIDTFGCGHARAYNTWVDANGQSRCMICRQGRRKAA